MFRVRPPASSAVAALAVGVLILGTAACTDDGADAGAAVTGADPDACPGEVLDVVVSVGQWGDVTRRLAGDCASVTTVAASGSVDPQEVEPGSADLAAFADADLVVLNGAGYDRWAEGAVTTADPRPVVVSAAEVAGVEEGADPHLWYEPAAVHAMAPAVAEQLSALSPDAAAYFEERAAAWQSDLRRYTDAVTALSSLVAGRTYAATGSVFGRMAATVGLTDATPEGYRRSLGAGSQPAPGDLAAFEAALTDGTVDVLIHDPRTGGSVPQQLVDAAGEAGVPVVEVTGSAPDGDGSFVAWQLDQLRRLAEALQPR